MRHLDLSSRAKFLVTGLDRFRYLNGQLTNDLGPLSSDPGTAIYAFALTAKGKLAGDLYLRAWGDALLVDAEAELRETLQIRLERYVVADDVSFEDVTERFALWHWPDPGDRLEAPGGARLYRATRLRAAGTDAFFAAGDVPPAGSEPIDPAEAETRRVLEGIPRWGHELDENTLPQEAGVDERALSYTKGCYLGQEVVSRIKSVGHVNRRLTKLHVSNAPPDLAGARLTRSDDAGKTLGLLTSLAPGTDAEGARPALAYTRRGSVAPGDRLLLLDLETSRLLADAEVTSFL